MPPANRIRMIMRRVRRTHAQNQFNASREQRQAVIDKLINGLALDDPRGQIPNLEGGFLFLFPLVDDQKPDRALLVTFVKTGYRTFTVKGVDTGDGGVRHLGSRTLRGDIPVHRAAAAQVIALYGLDFLTNATP